MEKVILVDIIKDWRTSTLKELLINRAIWLVSIVTVGALVIFLLFGGNLLYILYWPPEPTEYEFTIELTTNNTNSYTVILPITMDERIVEKISFVNGEGEYRFINTTYGRAIEIRSNRSLTMKSTARIDEAPHLDYVFSTSNLTRVDRSLVEYAWIFSDELEAATNITYKVTSYRTHDDWGRMAAAANMRTIEGCFHQGWQKVEISGWSEQS